MAKEIGNWLDALLNKTFEALSKDEFAAIVEEDLQFCVDNKTARRLSWMFSLDAKYLPTGTTFEVECSPDVRIGIRADDKDLHLYVKTTEKGEIFSDYFSLNDSEYVFDDALEAAEDAKREIEGEELEEGEDIDDPGDR